MSSIIHGLNLLDKTISWEDIDPLEKSFVPVKQQAFHRYLHPYFTKQAHNVIQNYIKYFSVPGEIVLDPFCGTGVTGVEAVALGRSAVLVDLSPLAEFMSRVLLAKGMKLSIFDSESERIQKAIAQICIKIEAIGGQNPIDQGDKLPKWVTDLRIDRVNLNLKLPKNSDVKHVRDLFDERQYLVGCMIKAEIDKIKDPLVKDCFGLAFCGALARSNLTYLLSGSREGSILHNGGPSIFGEYRYHVPENRVFVPMWDMFLRRLKYMRQIKSATQGIYSLESNASISGQVIRGNTLELSSLIKKNSVDYIYTDPPYGAHIAYLDLAKMWSAWMDWSITDADLKAEVIEGGDVNNSREKYLELLGKSIEQSYQVLKPGRWLSIVFQHKDSTIWSSLVNSFKDIGFQYRNTVVQRTFNSSIHKKKNPLNVLAEQLILNFTKSTKTVVSYRHVDIPVKDIAIEAGKKAIILYDGATLDDIYNTLTPALIEAGLLHLSKSVLDNLENILLDNFAFDEKSHRYKLKKTSYLTSNLGSSDKLVLYLRSVFNKSKRASLEQVFSSILPSIADDRSMKNSDLFSTLMKIAKTDDGKTFILRDAFEDSEFPAEEDGEEIPIHRLGGKVSHNAIVMAIAQAGKKLGYDIWIGKPEQAKNVKGVHLGDLSMKKLPIKMTPKQKRLVQQIDCIWFRGGLPIRAFEVESSTDIEGAFKRFLTLLELNPAAAGKLHIIAADSKRKKLHQVFSESVYVGQPYLMQNKVHYCFIGTFANKWNMICDLKKFDEADFTSVFQAGGQVRVDLNLPSDLADDMQLSLLNSEDED